jgi:hypothetical protein
MRGFGGEHIPSDLVLPPPEERRPEADFEAEMGRREQKALDAIRDSNIFSSNQTEKLSRIEDGSTLETVVFRWPGDPFKPEGIAVVDFNDEGRVVNVRSMVEVSSDKD